MAQTITSESWYFQSAEGVVGPLSADELRRLVAAGRLRPDDPVWQSWSPRGVPLGAVPAAAVLRKKRLMVLLAGPPGGAVARLGPLVRGWGHQTRLARPGPEVLRAAGRYEPDVVLLDLDEPGADGVALASALRQAASPPAVVALAGPAADAAAPGPDDPFRYRLEKPADPNVLALLLALVGQERGAARPTSLPRRRVCP